MTTSPGGSTREARVNEETSAAPEERPKILIALTGGPLSDDTSRFGGRIAKAVQADLSVLYVQPRSHHQVRQELRYAERKLAEWEIELPGVRVLRRAREVLLAMGLVRTDATGDPDIRHELRPDIEDAFELHVYGRRGQDIRLRLREGEFVDEVLEEIKGLGYELVVMSAGTERRRIHKIMQFSPCSTLIVRGPFRLDFDFLVATDGSPGARHAAAYGARLASFFGGTVRAVAVAASEEEREEARGRVERLGRLMARARVPFESRVRIGDVVDTIVEEAGSDHVIVLGPTGASQLRQFFLGSTPVKVAVRASVPVLLVR